MAGAPLRHSLTSSRVSCPQSFTGSSCEQNYSSFRSRGPLLTSVACYTYTVLHNTSKWDCLSTIVIFHNYIPLNLHISIYSINLKGGQSCHPISRVQSNSSNLITHTTTLKEISFTITHPGIHIFALIRHPP